MKYTKAILIFALFAHMGFWIVKKSWNGRIFVNNKNFESYSRNPAALHKDLDYSVFSTDDRMIASQKRLIASAKVYNDSGRVGIEFGHFVTLGDDGQKKLACDQFNKIELLFEADKVATSDGKPMMQVNGPCQLNFDDLSRISAIWIPVQRIIASTPSSSDLQFPDISDASFRFTNVYGSWPKSWNLVSVRLYSDEPNRGEIKINQTGLREILEKPFLISW